jgi:hypothetical protein
MDFGLPHKTVEGSMKLYRQLTAIVVTASLIGTSIPALGTLMPKPTGENVLQGQAVLCGPECSTALDEWNKARRVLDDKTWLRDSAKKELNSLEPLPEEIESVQRRLRLAQLDGDIARVRTLTAERNSLQQRLGEKEQLAENVENAEKALAVATAQERPLREAYERCCIAHRPADGSTARRPCGPQCKKPHDMFLAAAQALETKDREIADFLRPRPPILRVEEQVELDALNTQRAGLKQAYDVAAEAYATCCRRPSTESQFGLPRWTYPALGGVGAVVGVKLRTGQGSTSTPPGTPTTGGSTTPPATSIPPDTTGGGSSTTPPGNPGGGVPPPSPPPPPVPTRTIGMVFIRDPQLTRAYQVEFPVAPNLNGERTAVWQRTSSTCPAGFFLPTYTGSVGFAETGDGAPVASAVASGQGTFRIGGSEAQGTLLVSLSNRQLMLRELLRVIVPGAGPCDTEFTAAINIP